MQTQFGFVDQDDTVIRTHQERNQSCESINTIADAEGNETVMYYQVDLELVEIESNRKLWIGTKKIKKYITRSKAKF